MRRRSSGKRVVIVGMGDTGVLVATRLSRGHDVVGITTKPLFVSGQELGARLVRPSLWRRDYLHEYGDFRRLTGVGVLHGVASAVDLDASTVAVQLADGGSRELAYDALVIATGATNGFWRTAEVQTRDEVEAALGRAVEALASAGSVAVIGGGPSAVSVASQLRDARPDVAVTLYHPHDEPLRGYHPRTRRRVLAILERQGVHRAPGHRAVVPDGAELRLGTGTIEFTSGQPPAEADVIVWAIGRRVPNTAFLPDAVLDADGFVRVDAALRVAGTRNVFSVGDVAATDPLRSSARNFAHRHVAANVRAVLEGRRRLRRFRAPRHRWGSVIGLQREGIRIFSRHGSNVLVTPGMARRILYPLLTHRLLYGGLRPRRPGQRG